MLTDIIEALIFASGSGLTDDALYHGLKSYSKEDIDNALLELKERYSGGRGIHLVKFNSTYQLQSNPDYGDTLSDVLVETRERELSKTLLQVAAIIAYKQPVTRLEVEELRGVNSDYVIAMLLKLNLIEPKGRKETVGYPILYGTTDEFLKKFGLQTISELPDYEELMHKIRTNYEKYYAKSSALYRDIEEGDAMAAVAAADLDDGDTVDEDDIPDFLQNEDFVAHRLNRLFFFSTVKQGKPLLFSGNTVDEVNIPDFLQVVFGLLSLLMRNYKSYTKKPYQIN